MDSWNWNDQNVTGLVLQDNGGGWHGVQRPFLGAFDVLTHDQVVPEPSTLAMLASGVVGLAGVIRRKLTV